MLQPGQPLLALVGVDEVWVVANFKETQLGAIHPGQHVSIAIDAFGHDVEGTVDSIAAATGASFSLLPAAERERQLRQGRAARAGEDRHSRRRRDAARLRPGLSVVPTIYTR